MPSLMNSWTVRTTPPGNITIWTTLFTHRKLLQSLELFWNYTIAFSRESFVLERIDILYVFRTHVKPRFLWILLKLAPCQWGFRPDSRAYTIVFSRESFVLEQIYILHVFRTHVKPPFLWILLKYIDYTTASSRNWLFVMNTTLSVHSSHVLCTNSLWPMLIMKDPKSAINFHHNLAWYQCKLLCDLGLVIALCSIENCHILQDFWYRPFKTASILSTQSRFSNFKKTIPSSWWP